MIDEDRNMQLYGYTSDELTSGSHKPIVAVCGECGKYRVLARAWYKELCVSCSKLGRPVSPETRLKLRRTSTGGNNGSWKGGISQQSRKSPAIRNWRKAVFERDNYTCQMCGHDKPGNLQAHHIRPVRDHKNDLVIIDVNNGITLCKDCHESIKGIEHAYIKDFEERI